MFITRLTSIFYLFNIDPNFSANNKQKRQIKNYLPKQISVKSALQPPKEKNNISQQFPNFFRLALTQGRLSILSLASYAIRDLMQLRDLDKLQSFVIDNWYTGNYYTGLYE